MDATGRDLLLLGASAGGLAALGAVLNGLRSPLAPAVIVVSHVPAGGQSRLPDVLTRATGLHVRWAVDGAPLRRGEVIVAPGGRHLVLDHEHVRLVSGARENHARPSISRAFRSVAACCGSRAVGVLLSGALDDGVSGLASLRRCGGLVAVQHPEDALVGDLPRNALAALAPDAIFRSHDAGEVIDALMRRPVVEVAVPDALLAEAKLDREGGIAHPGELRALGPHSVVTCPDCGGPTWSVGSADCPAFRCVVGHRLDASLSLRDKDREIERAIWNVVHGLEERLAIRRRLELGDGISRGADDEERLLARARGLAEAIVALQG